MQFNNDKPIYLQMADRLMDDIVAGVYTDEARIPSVREYAANLGVNTNTAMKTYDELSRMNIIYNKRGLGYFVSPGANEQIKEQRFREFREVRLPQLMREMRLIGMTMDELINEMKKLQTK